MRRGALKLIGSMPVPRRPPNGRRQPDDIEGTAWTSTRPAGPAAVSAAELEAPRALRKPGDTDAVTFSWADAEPGVYGLARVASGALAGRRRRRSALAVAFAGRETLGAIAEAGADAAGRAGRRTEAPLERWTLRARASCASS